MGYEPHIPALPTTLGWRDKALNGAWKKYRAALDQAAEVFGADALQDLTRNAAGSPTYRYYEDTEIANEISAGSCLVKPTHFDSELLEPHLASQLYRHAGDQVAANDAYAGPRICRQRQARLGSEL